MKRVTAEEIEAARTENGGWTEAQLSEWGIGWPPPKGWKQFLITGTVPGKAKNRRKKLKKILENRTEVLKSEAQAFFRSYEWRKARYEILKRDGGRCLLCGASASDGRVLNVDHIKPLKKFWALRLDPSNLQTLCNVCNHGKGNWDETDWRKQ